MCPGSAASVHFEMFSPVGSQAPSVYWRRRIIVLGSLVVLLLLLLLTIRVMTGGGDDTPLADGTGTSAGSSSSAASVAPSPPSSTSTSAASASQSRTSATERSSAQPSTRVVVMPARCLKADLALQAVPGQSKYKVGQQPTVSLQVTNTGARPCVQDLADKQVVLKIYNGESRVWASHDCEIQPGTADRTLPMGQAVRVSITWSGRTSQEGCKGTRQRVGAGTYTLYAQLAGTSGKAGRFTIG